MYNFTLFILLSFLEIFYKFFDSEEIDLDQIFKKHWTISISVSSWKIEETIQIKMENIYNEVKTFIFLKKKRKRKKEFSIEW